MHRLMLIVLVGLLSATATASGLLWRWSEQRGRQAAAVTEQLRTIRTKNSAMRDSLTMLTLQVRDYRSNLSFWAGLYRNATETRSMLLDLADISGLENKGLRDPGSALRRDLVSHPELIPLKGVLGGTMRFREDTIALLSTRWAFAKFDDGHSAGACLLSYDVTPDGQISWKLLFAVLD